MSRGLTWAIGGTAAVVVAAIGGLWPIGREQPAATFPAAASRHVAHADRAHADELRDQALRRAKVWRPTDPAATDLAANPPDPNGALSDAIVRCRFLPRPARGTTPKFDCVLSDGEVVKVK